MSISSKFSFTNATASTHPVTPVVMDPASYALVTDDPGSCVLSNNTAAIDQGETLSYQARKITNVSSVQTDLYPSKVQSGIQYQIKLDELLSTTSDTDPTFRVDQPIVAYLTIRHPLASEITSAHIETIFKRLVGACMKSDGSYRFADLMRSALRPE